MLTWSEIQSTMQIDFELRLEALEEELLRELLQHPQMLRRMAPGHLTDEEVQAIGDKALEAVVARKAAEAAVAAAAALLQAPATAQPAAAGWLWPTLFPWMSLTRR
ncbi:hypothetical protein [Azohydromonas aeria]|uniref:hypothetical protein n=1 Tax=Azohydromonas aeria TaxID=2590212 RepID=UPI0012F95129|nr:hypothetical protein [Azohydromonas aeria]